MSFFSENIIPGNHGVIFTTNAKDKRELEHLFARLQQIDGIKDVICDDETFPIEVTIHTSKLINVHELQDLMIPTGIHLVPKTLFGL